MLILASVLEFLSKAGKPTVALIILITIVLMISCESERTHRKNMVILGFCTSSVKIDPDWKGYTIRWERCGPQ